MSAPHDCGCCKGTGVVLEEGFEVDCPDCGGCGFEKGSPAYYAATGEEIPERERPEDWPEDDHRLSGRVH